MFLTKYASHVTCLVRGDDFSCAKATADEARNHPDITVRTHTVVESVEGDALLRRLTCRDTETGETKTYDAGKDTFGVFVFAGYEPATELIRGIAELDPKGYVITDASMKTSCDGLYAAGDIRIKPLRQCITAAGDGALAATELERYALQMQKKTGIRPLRPAAAVPEEPEAESASSQLFQPEVVRQLQTVFSRMERGLELRLYLDDSAKSGELASYVDELARLTASRFTACRAAMNSLPSCWASTTRQGRDRPWTNHCASGCSTGIRLVTCASSSACPARSVQSSSQRLSALRP